MPNHVYSADWSDRCITAYASCNQLNSPANIPTSNFQQAQMKSWFSESSNRNPANHLSERLKANNPNSMGMVTSLECVIAAFLRCLLIWVLRLIYNTSSLWNVRQRFIAVWEWAHCECKPQHKRYKRRSQHDWRLDLTLLCLRRADLPGSV